MPDVVQPIDLALDPAERLERVAVFPHQHDAGHDLVAIVHADDTQTGRIADTHVGDIGHRDRRAFVRGQHDVANVVERMDEADAANVEGLLADREIIPACVGVRVRDRAGQSCERHLVIGQLLRIYVDLVLFRQPAKTADIDHTRNCLELLLKHPVLDLLLLEQVVIGTLHRVAVNFTDRILRRNPRA